MMDTDSYNHRFILISLKEKGLMETGAEASFQFLNMTGFLILERASMKRPYRVGAGQRAGGEVLGNIRGCYAVFAMTELF